MNQLFLKASKHEDGWSRNAKLEETKLIKAYKKELSKKKTKCPRCKLVIEFFIGLF